jgi:hypothetical protein
MRRFTVLLAALAILLAVPAQSEEAAESETVAPAASDAARPAGSQMRGDKARKGGQGGKTPEQRAEAFRGQLLEGIELSGDQSRRIDEIQRAQKQRLEEQQKKSDELREKMKSARKAGETEKIQAYGKELREMRKDAPARSAWISEVRDVLDPDQQKQFDANREKIQKDFNRRRNSAKRKKNPQ